MIDETRANDELRQYFRGGRIEVHHAPYDLDDRIIGRTLCVLARYDRFEEGGLHDSGVFTFAGFSFAFQIDIENGERVLKVWVQADVLNGAG